MAEFGYARSLPLEEGWDVLVAGGGPAGCTAAIAAAREGAKTLLIEATGILGGLGTAGLVPAWCPFSDKQKIIYRGLAEKVLRAASAPMRHVDPERLDWVPIDPEQLKRVYDEFVLGSGAKVRFHAVLADVAVKDGRIDAVIVADKDGLKAIRAKTYIDATGDADLAARAGVPFLSGDGDGNHQAATLCFTLSGVNEYHYLNGPNLHSGNPQSPVHAAVASGKYPLIDRHLCNNLIGPGTVGFNASHVQDVDGTDPEQLSAGLLRGRQIAAQLHEALKEMHPAAFAGSFLVQTASLLGIRETRRIVGDYVLTMDDYVAKRDFPDEICRNSYFIDVHKGSKGGGENMQHRYQPGESHGIPYRCLVPKNVANLLVAGRSISTERPVQGSTRVMPVCLAMGEAAGLAASLAPAGDVRAVDTEDLRRRLREHGAYLP